MSRTSLQTLEEKTQILMEKLDMHLVIPRVVLEKEWDFRGAMTYFLYVSREKPLFFIQPLFNMFHDSLVKDGVNPREKVRVGGKTNNHPPRGVLEIKTQNLNQSAIETGKQRRRVRVVVNHLVVRRKDKGISLSFFKRAVKIIMFKGYKMSGEPGTFINNMLVKYNYPRYVAMDAIQGNNIDKLIRLINDVKLGEVRGWPMIL